MTIFWRYAPVLQLDALDFVHIRHPALRAEYVHADQQTQHRRARADDARAQKAPAKHPPGFLQQHGRGVVPQQSAQSHADSKGQNVGVPPLLKQALPQAEVNQTASSPLAESRRRPFAACGCRPCMPWRAWGCWR